MPKTSGLLLRKPVSRLHRELGLDLKEFLKALGGAIASGATGNVTGAATNAVNAAAALKFKDHPGMMAYQLLYRSLLRAMYRIAEECRQHLIGLDGIDKDKVADKLDMSFEENEVRIDHTFFERPRELPLLRDVEVLIREWLMGLSMESARAKTVAGRLKSEFVWSLHYEWTGHSSDYELIRIAVDSPFTRATGEERNWLWYRDFLDKTVHEPVFGQESFSVEDVFVPLRAYYETVENMGKRTSGRITVGSGIGEETVRTPVFLQARLQEWVDNRESHCPSLIVLAGGPGSGKSTSVRIFARDMMRSGVRVLLVPLYQFDLQGDIETRVRTYIKRLTDSIWDPVKSATEDEPVLLVFDGLDELPEQGRVAVNNARNFISQLKSLLDTVNHSGVRLKALITGRTVALQASVIEGVDRSRCLYLVDYFVPEIERKIYTDEEDVLAVDQRDEWWLKYGRATGKLHEGIPQYFKKGDRLDELTAQPLLNYLLALLYDDPLAKIDFESDLNMAEVYGLLLNQVYRRVWADMGQRGGQATIQGISEEDFLQVMQGIALATWHGTGRLVTLEQVERCCQDTKSPKLVRMVAKEAESGALNLLTAFYFRKHGPMSGQETFGFTHKSFQEYLIATKIVKKIKELYIGIALGSSVFSEENALEGWAKTCGPTAMDENLFEFLKDLIALELKAGEDVAGWQDMLGRLIGYVLVFGLPMQKFEMKYKEMTRQARNAEEALLVCLNACSQATAKVSEIDWPGVDWDDIGEWLSFLAGDPGNRNATRLVTDILGQTRLRIKEQHPGISTLELLNG